ncbi:cytochrome P450 [Ascobolus immersus RN42]|uniref:Cytochrome P450 n=1 Tax=Ascobolus immersus RN42 TaxID=1160509 RepID=A0A3N4HJA3_ASCIM|nr:cytochrome P450 [Ascobolus immersus RN42]
MEKVLLPVFDAAKKLTVTPASVLGAVGTLFLCYHLSSIIYNIFFHPLRSFPGPFLAKFSRLYELWYDIPKGGQFCFHCEEVLHPTYGPIVRTGPNRLRIQGIDAFAHMSRMGTRFIRDEKHYQSNGTEDTMVTTPSNEDHRQRRKYFEPGFTKNEVIKREPLLRRKFERAFGKLEDIMKKNGGVAEVDMNFMFMCTALEIFSEFSFGIDSTEFLDAPNFAHPFVVGIPKIEEDFNVVKHFKFFLITLPGTLPKWFRDKANIDKYHKQFLAEQAGGLRTRSEKGKPGFKPDTILDSVFNQLGTSGIPPTMYADIGITFAASFGTISKSSACAITHINREPRIKELLLAELRSITPNSKEWITYSQCEHLPYISACVKETLRLAQPVCGALSRISPVNPPNTPTVFHNRVIPPNTNCECTIYSNHMNPKVFPNPTEFLPERWLLSHATQAEINERERWMVPFGRGAKICLGMHMAYMQVYLTIANFSSRYEVELNDELLKEGYRFNDKFFGVPRSNLRVKFRERGD